MRSIILNLIFLSLLSIATSSLFAKEQTNNTPTEIRDSSSFFDESLNDLEEERNTAKEDGKKGIVFNMMYGNELIYDIEYEQTLKNLKRNNNFRIKDGKDEDYFLDTLVQYGDKIPASYWDKV